MMTNYLMDRVEPALGLLAIWEWWSELEQGWCPNDLWYVIGNTDCSLERAYAKEE